MKSWTLKQAWLLAIILIITAICLSPSLLAGFTQWDDNLLITDNLAIRHLTFPGVKFLFTSTFLKNYIPLTMLTYAVEYKITRLQPFLYHFNNLLLHLLNILLIFRLALKFKLSKISAGVAAIIFAIHPLHVEPVAWATGRKDLLYSFFYLLCLLSYSNYAKSSNKKHLLSSYLFGLLSILSKPMALSLPLILFLCDWFWGRRFRWSLFTEKIPFFLFIIPITWLTYRLHIHAPGNISPQGILLWVWCFISYIKKFIVPYPIQIYYAPPSPENLLTYLTALGLFILIFCFLIKYRKNRLLLFAFLYYFFSVFFLLRFSTEFEVQIVADRFMYLPSLGLCFLTGQQLVLLSKRIQSYPLGKSILITTFSGIFLLTAGFTAHRAYLWGHENLLWKEAVSRSPNGITHLNLGDYYFNKKKFPEALENYEACLRYNPTNYIALLNVASLYSEQNKIEEAFALYRRILTIKPDYYYVYLNRGILLERQKRYRLALTEFNKFIKYMPKEFKGYIDRANTYLALNQVELALKDYNKAISLNPNYSLAFFNRGIFFMQIGFWDEAEHDFKRSLQLSPENTIALDKLKIVRKRQLLH